MNGGERNKEKNEKKQHKVRRKILMGGSIWRKNRSMPDLTDAQEAEKEPAKKTPIPIKSVSGASPNGSSVSGYLSEGHFDWHGPHKYRYPCSNKTNIFAYNKNISNIIFYSILILVLCIFKMLLIKKIQLLIQQQKRKNTERFFLVSFPVAVAVLCLKLKV